MVLREEKASYLYHVVFGGDSLRDGMLYPLSEIATKHPDLYELYAAKYADRPQVPQQRIPHLNCLWGDVVFLTPVHPDRLCLVLAQCLEKSFPSFAYQEIPVADLDYSKLVIWPFRSREFDPAEVVLFTPELLGSLREVPESTREYLLEERSNDGRPLLFVHVPHVLYKGAINMSGYPLLRTEPR